MIVFFNKPNSVVDHLGVVAAPVLIGDPEHGQNEDLSRFDSRGLTVRCQLTKLFTLIVFEWKVFQDALFSGFAWYEHAVDDKLATEYEAGFRRVRSVAFGLGRYELDKNCRLTSA